jgi:hypothetical protein
MQRTVIYGDKLVNDVDMNSLQSYMSGNVVDYTHLNLTWSDNGLNPTSYSVYKGGVLGDFRNVALSQDLKILQNGTGSLTLCSGKALITSGSILFNPSGSVPSISPNLVVVPSNVVMYTFGSSSVYSWSGNTSGTYYVKLAYAENLTTYASGVSNTAGFTRAEGSYLVKINQTLPATNELCLASVSVLSSAPMFTGSIVSVSDVRSYVTTLVPSWGVSLDPTLNTISGINTAYDHVIARGTGILTQQNPHALGPNDIQALSSASLTKFGAITPGYMTVDAVYKNGSGTVYFDANVEFCMGDHFDLPANPLMAGADYGWSLFASSSGSLIPPTGSLGGGVIELARQSVRFIRNVSTDTFYVGDGLQAFIPPNWYYKVSASLTSPGYQKPTGSIRFTTTSL